LRLVRGNGYLSVKDAATELGVDTSTVRRDFAHLDRLGLIERSHGGALPVRDEAEGPYNIKLGRLVPEKRAIAELTASLIPEGASVILDSGSTTLMVARALADHRGLTVITPDVRVAAELAIRPGIRLIVPGGEGIPGTSTLVSQESVEDFRRFTVDIAVIAADGVDEEAVTNMNGTVVPLKQAMINAADRSILVMDSSKFGLRKLMKVAPVQHLSEVVTDAGLAASVASSYPVPVRRASPGQNAQASS
jgi:DeoR/GlpR family transcriptional regulator of sugar metabolism